MFYLFETSTVIKRKKEKKKKSGKNRNAQDEYLPLVGNGVYVVTMRLRKDMPNYMPMYERKVCLDYNGIKRQCNSCYGPHIKKYCKNERMSIEEFAIIFDNLNYTCYSSVKYKSLYMGQAILLADGHKSMSYKTPSITADLFFNFKNERTNK